VNDVHHSRAPAVTSTNRQDHKRTTALLDRLLHRSVVLDIAGDSYRLRDHHARTDKLRAGTRPGNLR